MGIKNILALTLAVVFFTACGKKKEEAKQGEAPAKGEISAPAPTVAAEEEAKKKAAAEAAKAEADKKAKEGRGSVAKNRVGKNQGGKHHGGHKKNNQKPNVVQPDKIDTDHGLNLTKGKAKNGLIFTGSSRDSVLADLVDDEGMKLAEIQNKNNVLAAAIVDMAYQIDDERQLKLDIEFKKGEGLSSIQAKADFVAGPSMQIVANRGTDAEVAITARCIDQNLVAEGCANLLVILAQGGSEAVAVLRQTQANIHYKHPDAATQKNEFGKLVRFFENAKLDAQSPNKLHSAYLNTFEVVHGKAGFKAIITGTRNQVIAFKGNLVLSKDLNTSHAPVTELTQLKDIDLSALRAADADLGFIKTISDAKLVQNSTRGQVEIEMVVNSASTGSKNALKIQFTRIEIPAAL